MTNRIAIIPARGGSKRIPLKNIILFHGRPMISWTIAAALDSKMFKRVVVSTEDEEIAAVATSEGAEVPFFRAQYEDDMSPVSLATIAALDQAEEHWQESYDCVVQLMPNCPLRGAEDIVNALDQFESANLHFQISVFEFGWMNPWWALLRRANGQPKWLFPARLEDRSQDLDQLYCPTGAIWIAKCNSLRKAGTFYGLGHVAHPMPRNSAIDIDDYEDLHIAEALAFLRDK